MTCDDVDLGVVDDNEGNKPIEVIAYCENETSTCKNNYFYVV